MDYEGIVIEESLASLDVLKRMRIISTSTEPVTERHQTPWISHWTYHTVSIREADAPSVAEAISRALDSKHPNSWYADFKNETSHYVIFRDRVFLIDRRNPDQYREAQEYGISRGLPEHQADFVALIEA